MGNEIVEIFSNKNRYKSVDVRNSKWFQRNTINFDRQTYLLKRNKELLNIFDDENDEESKETVCSCVSFCHCKPKLKPLLDIDIEDKEATWLKTFNLLNKDPKLPRSMPKIIAKVRNFALCPRHVIWKLCCAGVSCFYIKLSNHTQYATKNFIDDLNYVQNRLSIFRGVNMNVSLMFEITSRYPCIGGLKNDVKSVYLDKKSIVFITCDRRYCRKGCGTVLYVNMLDYIDYLKPYMAIDIEHKVNHVQLNIQKISGITVKCIVRKAGIVMRGARVCLPSIKYCTCPEALSKEMIQDIKFAKSCKESVEILVMPKPLDFSNTKAVKDYIKPMFNPSIMVLAKVRPSDVREMFNLECLDEYDGIIYKNISTQYYYTIQACMDKIEYHIFEYCYQKRKAIIMYPQLNPDKDDFLPLQKSEQDAFFLYPDCFLIGQDHCYEYVYWFRKILQANYDKCKYQAANRLNNTLTTEIITHLDVLMRKISYATQICDISAIVMTSKTGRSIIKLTHFRPICPIIVLTHDTHVAKKLLLYNNVHSILVVRNDNCELLTQEQWSVDTYRTMIYGIYYGLQNQLLAMGDNVLLCYRSNMNLTYPDTSTIRQVVPEMFEDEKIESSSLKSEEMLLNVSTH